MEAINYATLGLIAIPVIRQAIKSYRADRKSVVYGKSVS
jgi:hypothetical protein